MVVHADKLKTCYSNTPTTSLEPTDDFEPAETVSASPAQPEEQQTNVSYSCKKTDKISHEETGRSSC